MTIDRCGDKFIITIMAPGLFPGRLADSMLKNPSATTTQILKKAQKYIKLEEVKQIGWEDDGKKEEIGKRSSSTIERGDTRDEIPKPLTGLKLMKSIDKIFKEIRASPMERKDKSEFYDFHHKVGHRMNECQQLAREIENLVRGGQLKEFLKAKPYVEKVAHFSESRQFEESEDRRRRDRRSDRESNIVYVIHAETKVGGLTRSDRKRKLYELYNLSSYPVPKGDASKGASLSFLEENY